MPPPLGGKIIKDIFFYPLKDDKDHILKSSFQGIFFEDEFIRALFSGAKR